MPSSGKSAEILTLIAEGRSYEQIVAGCQGFSYRDIFHAAEEALRLNEQQSDHHHRMAAIKAKYSRAYEKWSEAEDAELKCCRVQGASVDELAFPFQRQPSAIRSRLFKFIDGRP